MGEGIVNMLIKAGAAHPLSLPLLKVPRKKGVKNNLRYFGDISKEEKLIFIFSSAWALL